MNRDSGELKKEVAQYKPNELTMDQYSHHLIGTPEECVEKLNIYKDLGISELVLQFPSMGIGDMGSLQLFAETIIPEFKN